MQENLLARNACDEDGTPETEDVDAHGLIRLCAPHNSDMLSIFPDANVVLM